MYNPVQIITAGEPQENRRGWFFLIMIRQAHRITFHREAELGIPKKADLFAKVVELSLFQFSTFRPFF